MKITVDGQVYEYDAAKMLNTEAIALQKVTGMRVAEWTKALQEGDAYAMTGLVWLLFRRNDRDVAFDDVEFDIGALEIEDDEETPDPTPAEADVEVEASPT